MGSALIEQVAAGLAPSLVPLSVEQYHVMLEKGILRDGDPIELLQGLLVRKNRAAVGENEITHGTRHASVVSRLVRLQRLAEPLGFHVRVQLPATLSDIDEPEPDVAIVRGSVEDFAERHPGPDAFCRSFEVSDSSLGYDRGAKRRVYADAGVRVYVIVNIPDQQIERYEQPVKAQGRYEGRQDFRSGDKFDLPLGDGKVLTLTVDEVLGPPRR